jgi:hypothetical protein
MATRPSTADLTRDLAEVARGLDAWRRGEPEEAVIATLALSGGTLHDRRYTFWAWTGATPEGEPAVALPVGIGAATRFSPRGPADVLVRCLVAAVDAGGRAEDVRLEEWDGQVCLVAPGMDLELAALALTEAHEGRTAQAEPLPPDVPIACEPVTLPPQMSGAGGGLAALAAELSVHPVEAALALLATGQPVPMGETYHDGIAHQLRERGYAGTPAPVVREAPSLAIADDPCPRRRHARTVLQRMLRMGKVTANYHTEFKHFYRGAAAHERRQALEVAEALIRAGLLGEKPSVGQRHIYLRREALPEIHALIERGETSSPILEEIWTAPAPSSRAAPARSR